MKSPLTCPECRQRRVYENVVAGRPLTCPDCRRRFQLDAQGQPQRIPAAAAAVPDLAIVLAILACLDYVEMLGKCMIVGIYRFLTQEMPQWLAHCFSSLGRIAVKLGRVLWRYSPPGLPWSSAPRCFCARSREEYRRCSLCFGSSWP